MHPVHSAGCVRALLTPSAAPFHPVAHYRLLALGGRRIRHSTGCSTNPRCLLVKSTAWKDELQELASTISAQVRTLILDHLHCALHCAVIRSRCCRVVSAWDAIIELSALKVHDMRK